MQVVGGRLRVTVQLIDAATDEHLWDSPAMVLASVLPASAVELAAGVAPAIRAPRLDPVEAV